MALRRTWRRFLKEINHNRTDALNSKQKSAPVGLGGHGFYSQRK
jgi:hypothetical protein